DQTDDLSEGLTLWVSPAEEVNPVILLPKLVVVTLDVRANGEPAGRVVAHQRRRHDSTQSTDGGRGVGATPLFGLFFDDLSLCRSDVKFSGRHHMRQQIMAAPPSKDRDYPVRRCRMFLSKAELLRRSVLTRAGE